MDKETTGIVAYITWIGLLIAFIAGDREGAKFHLNQALAVWIVSTVGGFVPIFGWAIQVFAFVCCLIGLVYAIQREEKEVPLIGKIKLLK